MRENGKQEEPSEYLIIMIHTMIMGISAVLVGRLMSLIIVSRIIALVYSRKETSYWNGELGNQTK
jgi:hypothetical protein